MKTSPHYQPKSDRLTLNFDRDTQRAIRTVADEISQLFGGEDPSTLPQDRDLSPDDNLFNGFPLLKRLGTTKVLKMVTTGRDANLALGVICWATLHISPDQERSSTWEQAVLFLASVTPVKLPLSCLPPPAKVFGRRATLSRAGQSYENLRLSRECSVLQMFRLSEELRRLPRPSLNLLRVIQTLDASSTWVGMALKGLSPAET